MSSKRTLYMIRHAKSSWSNPADSDFERPLNDRGKRDSPFIGSKLKEKNILPDIIISSTAKRAAQTAKKIATAIGYDISNIKWLDKLYHCSPASYEEVLYELDDDIQSVCIVSHNPGVTQFVNEQSDSFYTDNMPTCAVVGIEFDLNSWQEFNLVDKRIILFEYPKKYI